MASLSGRVCVRAGRGEDRGGVERCCRERRLTSQAVAVVWLESTLASGGMKSRRLPALHGCCTFPASQEALGGA